MGNTEGRNLRKVRLQIRRITQKGRQEVRNYPESQVCESIQWKGWRQKSRSRHLEMQVHKQKDCRWRLPAVYIRCRDCQDSILSSKFGTWCQMVAASLSMIFFTMLRVLR